jgi:hypothetical protein
MSSGNVTLFMPTLFGSVCNIYDGSGEIWPRQCFPAPIFLKRYTTAEFLAAKAAWSFFEMVESHDAAVRVRLSVKYLDYATPSTCGEHTSIWYKFRGNEERMQYLRGKYLHAELCPNYQWVSQRDRGITPPPVNVYPLPR